MSDENEVADVCARFAEVRQAKALWLRTEAAKLRRAADSLERGAAELDALPPDTDDPVAVPRKL